MEVAAAVGNIISAFGNGMNLFRRMIGKRSKRPGREPTLSEEEAWLHHSLSERPIEINAEYNRGVARLGPRFETGDTAAYTSLAHTLLVLNIGLSSLINDSLSNHAKTRAISRKSLLNLSEVAAADTLHALRQLGSRLSMSSQLSLTRLEQPKDVSTRGHSKTKIRSRQASRLHGSQQTLTKRPSPAPLLVRGGWVRSKSSSVVSSNSSTSKVNAGGRANHIRSKSESAINQLSKASSPSTPSTKELEKFSSNCTCGNGRHFLDMDADKRRRSQEMPTPRRPPSMLLVPADFFENTQALQNETPPPRPPKIPLHSKPIHNIRPRPPSMATFRSGSTKIGEIPERRQSEQIILPVLQGQELVASYVTPQALGQPEAKKKSRGLKFWKREERNQNIKVF